MFSSFLILRNQQVIVVPIYYYHIQTQGSTGLQAAIGLETYLRGNFRSFPFKTNIDLSRPKPPKIQNGGHKPKLP